MQTGYNGGAEQDQVGCWDASYGVVIRVSLGIGSQGWRLAWPDTAAWVGAPTPGNELVR